MFPDRLHRERGGANSAGEWNMPRLVRSWLTSGAAHGRQKLQLARGFYLGAVEKIPSTRE